jgi:hypothetical protein
MKSVLNISEANHFYQKNGFGDGYISMRAAKFLEAK